MNSTERIREVIRITGKTLNELGEITNIGADRIKNINAGKVKPRIEDIQALAKLHPEYAHWLAFGEELPESGQISPMTAEAIKSNRA